MGININCKHNNQGAWCRNKKVKRSLFGIGARCCVEYPYNNGVCEHKEEYTFKFRPPSVPPSVPPSQRDFNIKTVEIVCQINDKVESIESKLNVIIEELKRKNRVSTLGPG